MAMPRRPNNAACCVHAIMLDLGSGADHASDALPATSVTTGMAIVTRITRRRSVCRVVVPYISVGSADFCLASLGDLFASPAIKLSYCNAQALPTLGEMWSLQGSAAMAPP